jgi:hypothetical protein
MKSKTYISDSPTPSETEARFKEVRVILSAINTNAHPVIIPAATAVSVPILDFGRESMNAEINNAPMIVPANDIKKGAASRVDILYKKLMKGVVGETDSVIQYFVHRKK